ncbi:MAG: biopolymer transporter ExbD [Ferruginibacter sp.]
MAALETNNTTKRNKQGIRMRKKSTRVDLTPMVDLGFLLITFFVFTTTMARPTAMGIVYPKDETDRGTDICESCALTVIPADGNKIYYYEGMLRGSTVFKNTTFNAEGLRALLMDKKQRVKSIRGNEDELALIIRPSDKSTYKNFVDVLDEVHITGIKRYFIDDISAGEEAMIGHTH